MRFAFRLLLSSLALLVVAAPVAAGEESYPETLTSPSSVGEVVFPHRAHVEDFGFECVECHHETRAAELTMPHPAYLEDYWLDCGVCHRADGAGQASQSCTSCHPESPASASDQTISSKVAIHRSCWRCHESSTGVEASSGCTFCHQVDRAAASRAVASR
jgi:c(7)-type cytochrome triheme protein